MRGRKRGGEREKAGGRKRIREREGEIETVDMFLLKLSKPVKKCCVVQMTPC